MTKFLVTGAYGCIGAWVVHELLARALDVVTFDLASGGGRLRLLLEDAAVDAVPHVRGDITDLGVVERTLAEHGITHVVHLAALQVPFCRADPPLGARVNVVGTVNVFEAAKRSGLQHLVYASSIAALDGDGGSVNPRSTIYGVYKRANEGTAAIYHAEAGLSSVGLRPHTVYGVGRDQGLTSAPTAAMLAAAAGKPYTIPYGGRGQLQLAADAARVFVEAALRPAVGASVHNLRGHVVSVEEVVAAIGAEGVVAEGEPLPFPPSVDASSLDELLPDLQETPLEEGVRATVERFRLLLREGKVSA